jgi:hypothetical protein
LRITFYGAAGEVGRSCILAESRDAKVMLDAGIKLGEKEEHPVMDDLELKGVDAVILSHAHLDHCGYVPHLFSNGYNGPVYGTKPTLELVNVIMNDYLGISKPKDVTKEGAQRAPGHFRMVEYHKDFRIKDMTARLLPAGHILGSSMTVLDDGKTRLLYTGDVNLRSTKLLEPAYTEHLSADALITESTYGGKGDVFPSEKAVLGRLVSSLKETISTGGKIIIPSFAVGRAQEILFILDDYIRSGILPQVPIYVDGMIGKVMRIYRHNVIYCKDEVQKRILMSEDDPFKSKNFNIVAGKAGRDRAIKSDGSCIIVTTSGMLKGGPVIRYLEKLAGDPNNRMIIVGYQAVGTPGRELQDGAKEVQVGDSKSKLDIRLKVDSFHLSAHADRPQLLKLVDRIDGLKTIFVDHGEEEKSRELYETLKNKFDARLPVLSTPYEI